MPSPFRVRLSAAEDVPRVVDLLNAAFRTPLDAPTWEWYVYGNPFGETRVYLLMRDETPVGVFAYTPVPLRIHGEPVKASSGHHLFLKPEHQGGPAFMALSRGALEGETAGSVRLALGVPNRRSYLPQKTLLHWSDWCSLDCLFKTAPTRREHSCRQVCSFAGEFDLFYERVYKRSGFCIDKNAAWMNWRFFGRPGNPYTAYVAGAQGRPLEGYVVLKRWREPDGYRKAHIVDLHASGEDALIELIAAAESYADGCNEVNVWAAAGFPYRGTLEAAGFVAREAARQPVIARTLAGAPLSFPGGAASFSYADGDFVY